MILKMFFNPCPPTLILGTFQNLIPLSLHIIIKKYLFYFRPIKQYIFEKLIKFGTHLTPNKNSIPPNLHTTLTTQAAWKYF